MKEISDVTYLMTKDDYISCMLAARAGRTDKQDKRLFIFSGIMLCAVGAVLQIFRVKMISEYQEKILAAALGVLGAVFIAYYDLIAPLIVKIKAERFCNKNTDKMISNTITVCDDGITVKNARYTAQLPYEMFSGSYNGKEVIVLYINKEECVFIPKRTLNESSLNEVVKIINEKIK